MEEEFLISGPQGNLVEANLQGRVGCFRLRNGCCLVPHKGEKGRAAVSDVNWELFQKQIRKTSSCSVCGKRFFFTVELGNYLRKMENFSLKKIKDINYPLLVAMPLFFKKTPFEENN